jgi:L-alanine-DL-glutamate epimerase-like enolase superfamily enzyme
MKITDVKTWVVATPPPHKGGTYWIFLKLTTDDGVSGYGRGPATDTLSRLNYHAYWKFLIMRP